MKVRFEELKSEINECFYEIVGILNEVIEHRTGTFTDMLEIGESIQHGSENFVRETDSIIENVSSKIDGQIGNLHMEQMKTEIHDATETFIEITEELEILSYNTICRTMALGEKGATITHISKEIKKYSSTVKILLEAISRSFNEMFEKFRQVADHLVENQLSPEDTQSEGRIIEEFSITSDVSVLIENSQFHDIFMQELEIINAAIADNAWSNAYEAGRLFGAYEKAISKLDFIKYSLQDKLEGIKAVMGDFIYSFNTDLQNIAGHSNILRLELNRVNAVSEGVCSSISLLKNTVDDTKGVVKITRNSVNNLGKQLKSFRNLVVITAVEVARINDESLRSVVVSMNRTESELQGLITKLHNNIDMWESLRASFMETFTSAEEDMHSVCSSGIEEERNTILRNSEHLDAQLDTFRTMFMADKYVRYFDSSTEKLMDLFTVYNDGIQQIFVDFNDKLGDDILSDDDFTRGRNDAEIKDILANEDDQSSIEFF